MNGIRSTTAIQQAEALRSDEQQSTRMQEVKWMKVESVGVSLMLMEAVVEERVRRCGFKGNEQGN